MGQGADGDFDRDGLSNFFEFLAKKNPLLSYGPVLRAEGDNQNIRLIFDAYPDRRYRLWRSHDLETMTPDAGYFTVDQESLNQLMTVPRNGERQFFALEIAMPE